MTATESVSTENEGNTNVHLVVCAHGLWGNPNHMKYMVGQLSKKYGDKIHILNSNNNSGSYTYDGIDICGDRLVDEIHAKVKELKSDGLKITKFSIIGYSLGGLFARYVIGILYKDEFFKEIQPHLFATFATPHLGIRREDDGMFVKFFNWVSSRMLSRVGEQLHFVDEYEDGLPILAVLAHPSRVFFKALASFEYRKIYANTRNDRTVPFWTASISSIDPFQKFDRLSLTNNEKFKPLVESITIKQEQPSFKEKASAAATIAPRILLFAVVGPILIPIWFIIALSTISVQSITSQRRVKKIMEHHEHNENGKDPSSFAVVASDIEEESIETVVNLRNFFPTSVSTTNTESRLDFGLDNAKIADFYESASFPQIALTDMQRDACASLNKLSFEKHAIYLDTLNAHASIVVRTQRFNSKAGREVVKHFVEEAFMT